MALVQLYNPTADPMARQLAAIQGIGGAIGQFGQLQDQQQKQEALALALRGSPGQGPKAIPASTASGGNIMAQLLGGGGGMPEPQGPPTAPTGGLLPGISQEEAMAYALNPQLIPLAMQQRAPGAAAEGFTLNPGDVRYDATGKVIAQVPQQLSPAEQARLDLDRQGLQLRRDQFSSDQAYQQAQLELERQGLAQAGAGGGADIGDIRNARLDYMDTAAPFIELSTNYEKLDSALASGTGEGDLSAIFNFMKALDPTSAVRDDERADATNSSGALQGLWNYYNQVFDGQALSEQQRKNFLNIAGSWLQQARDRQITYEQQHREQAELAGIDPARVVPDVIGRYREFAPPAPGGTTPLQEAGQGIVDTIVEGAQGIIGGPPPAAAQPGRVPAAPGAAPAAPLAPQSGLDDLGEGEVIRNPLTGEQLIVRNGQLVPYDG